MGLWYDDGTVWIELGSGLTDPGASAAFGTTPFGISSFGGTP